MSMTTPLRMSSVDIDDPDVEPGADTNKKQCSRCSEWLDAEAGYSIARAATGRRKTYCHACQYLYTQVKKHIAVKDTNGKWLVKLSTGKMLPAAAVATDLARRGYRISTLRQVVRHTPKPLAPAEAEEVAKQLAGAGVQIVKKATQTPAAKYVEIAQAEPEAVVGLLKKKATK